MTIKPKGVMIKGMEFRKIVKIVPSWFFIDTKKSLDVFSVKE